ncbi:MAG TPA: bifunctional phosphoribosyl-AMP cyclohydrolase/phosphoribosyl-ATP diphosphatase HisIE [Gemmatimonadaceae bacterium]|jgi:phosphoribosyl-ATP pyrophosphohydrolase/phosphoribosyl-AMP cyclohydrolase
MLDLNGLDFEKGGGLVTVVTQDASTGKVLMVAFASRESLERTLASGEMHYHSRTRGLWHKGATSGNTQRVVSLTADCDRDAVLARVVSRGPACHTGAVTCFGDIPAETFAELDTTIDERAVSGGSTSYTARLLADRNLRLKKIGEEASEFVTACADGVAGRASEEAADVLYHVLVALHAAGGSLATLRESLRSRRQISTRE